MRKKRETQRKLHVNPEQARREANDRTPEGHKGGTVAQWAVKEFMEQANDEQLIYTRIPSCATGVCTGVPTGSSVVTQLMRGIELVTAWILAACVNGRPRIEHPGNAIPRKTT